MPDQTMWGLQWAMLIVFFDTQHTRASPLLSTFFLWDLIEAYWHSIIRPYWVVICHRNQSHWYIMSHYTDESDYIINLNIKQTNVIHKIILACRNPCCRAFLLRSEGRVGKGSPDNPYPLVPHWAKASPTYWFAMSPFQILHCSTSICTITIILMLINNLQPESGLLYYWNVHIIRYC